MFHISEILHGIERRAERAVVHELRLMTQEILSMRTHLSIDHRAHADALLLKLDHLERCQRIQVADTTEGYEYRSEETASLEDCAAFTIPERRLIVLREDVYDGVTEENVFSRSTVIHELSHIVLEHAVTLQRGSIGQHRFFEDSEWQAKALTAAIMMPLAACRSVASASDLAQLCGTSVQAATYRLDRLVKDNIIPPKSGGAGLFD